MYKAHTEDNYVGLYDADQEKVVLSLRAEKQRIMNIWCKNGEAGVE